MSGAKFFHRIGLGGYLALIMGSLILVTTMVIVAIVSWRTSADIKASIGRELEELAFQTTDKLDRGMFERYREVQLLADRTLLGDTSITPDSKRRLLELMQKTYPSYAWIGLTDRQGKVLIATGKLLEGVDVSARPWFGDAFRGVYLHDVHDAVLLSKLLAPKASEPLRFFDVAFPYRDANGEPAGVLATHLSWQWAKEVEGSVLRPLADRSHVDTLIVSNKGIVLLGPKEWVGKQVSKASFAASRLASTGYTAETWEDGRQYLVGYSRGKGYLSYPGLGWTVLVRQPLEEAYRPLEQLQRTIALVGLSAALLFSLIGYVVARRITRPVAAVARAARAIEKGKSTTLPVEQSYFREVNTLSGTLNSLLGKLSDKEASLLALNASLEDRVKERTEELAEALDLLAKDNLERVKTEQALRASQLRLGTITDNMPAAILYIDREERFRFVNQTYLRWQGMEAGMLIGKTLVDTYSDDDSTGARYSQIEAYVKRALAGERVVFEVQRSLGGLYRHAELTYIPDLIDGEVQGFYVMIQDVTDRKNAQLHFEHHASHDALTSLPNRRAFMEKLEQAVLRATRHGRPLAVLFLDLNKFKAINDTLGHGAGDDVLVNFSRTLIGCVRKTDTVARLAGDEFVILAEELFGGDGDAILIAEKIMSALKAQPALNKELGQVTTSIGIAVLSQDDKTADALLARADHAMYESKKQASGWALG